MTVRWDFELKQGASFGKRITYRVKGGAPYDLTGCSARMQIRASYGAGDVAIELSTENGGIVLGGPEGTIELKISSGQTAAIEVASKEGQPPKRNLVHDFLLTWPDGRVQRLWEGACPIARGVTI